MSPRYVVITGGPGSGKTTLIELLAQRGFATVPEASIQVIAELNAKLGLEEQQRWRRANAGAFQDLVLERQIELERGCEGQPGFVFLDRGRLDGLAYLRHFGVQPSERQLELLLACPYEAVFLLATLGAFADRADSGRMSKREDSLAIGSRIAETYRERGYEVHPVPEASVEERLDFVLGRSGASELSR